MTTVRRQIAESLSDKPYRDALIKQHLSRWTAAQIRQIREDRGWTQAKLGSLADMRQSSISELEKPGKRQPTIDTLTRVAAALDVALLVEYVPFSRFVNHMASVPHVVLGISQQAMSVRSYDDDVPLRAFLSELESPAASTSDVPSTGTTWATAEETLEAYAKSLNEASGLPTVETPAAPPAKSIGQWGVKYDQAA